MGPIMKIREVFIREARVLGIGDCYVVMMAAGLVVCDMLGWVCLGSCAFGFVFSCCWADFVWKFW